MRTAASAIRTVLARLFLEPTPRAYLKRSTTAPQIHTFNNGRVHKQPDRKSHETTPAMSGFASSSHPRDIPAAVAAPSTAAAATKRASSHPSLQSEEPLLKPPPATSTPVLIRNRKGRPATQVTSPPVLMALSTCNLAQTTNLRLSSRRPMLKTRATGLRSLASVLHVPGMTASGVKTGRRGFQGLP